MTSIERAAWPPPALDQIAVLGASIEAPAPEGALDDEAAGPPIWATIVSGIAHIALAAVLWALVWATIPRLFGWQPTVITGGSMRPTIGLGDIVVTRPVPLTALVPGAVITFHDPVHPGGLITHRIIEVMPDGVLRTRGDANPTADTQLVSPSAIQGRAVVRIPYLGRPLIWIEQRQFLMLAAAVMILIGLVWTVTALPL